MRSTRVGIEVETLVLHSLQTGIPLRVLDASDRREVALPIVAKAEGDNHGMDKTKTNLYCFCSSLYGWVLNGEVSLKIKIQKCSKRSQTHNE